MRKGMYLALALTNIRKNRNTYIPYILACIGCIASIYMMYFIQGNEGVRTIPGADNIAMIMNLGIFVITIFSFVFLLYCNSFLIKRRQKELGLYNILGMEKGHIARIMSLETVLITLTSMAGGIAFGILGSKLALLAILKLAHIPAQFGFYVSGKGIVSCLVWFGFIFILTLVYNIRRVHLTQPIELLRGGSVGEREPKAKWLLALLGFICLGTGYYIAVTTVSPMEALALFLLAVLLVMAGTYLVFTTGSIAVLKVMRWKKSFYYKTKNFTSVSGMIYRMKQNAVGLASICVLSTGVLLMISTTVCLNFGMEDVMKTRYPKEINYYLHEISLGEAAAARENAYGAVEDLQIPAENLVDDVTLSFACIYQNEEVIISTREGLEDKTAVNMVLIPQEEYQRIWGEDPGLSDGEVLAYHDGKNESPQLHIGENDYKVKEWLKEWPLKSQPTEFYGNLALVVSGKDFDRIRKVQEEVYGESASTLELYVGLDFDGTKEEKLAYGHKLRERLEAFEASDLTERAWSFFEARQENYNSFYALYGGLFFLGIFLGAVFLMGTAMIIYYKQLSEGYEDRERFKIMQKVGMSRKEVRSSIRRQVLMVFFIPLIMAGIHIAMAFPLVSRLMKLLSMTNTHLFILCTVSTILVFAVVYGIIYSITAKVYYRIVERDA